MSRHDRFTLAIRLALLWCSLVLTACGGGGGGGGSTASVNLIAPASCAVADQRQWIRSVMADQYLWNTQLGTPNDAATSLPSYFDSLLYKPTDRYSFTQGTTEFNQLFTEGKRTGYGYSMTWTDAAHTQARLLFTEPLSPIHAAGARRGDTIISINGLTPEQIYAGLLPTVSTAGVDRTFVLRSVAGVTRTFTVTSAEFSLSPVLLSTTFDTPLGSGSARVGYLAYQEFVTSSEAALGSAIAAFASAGVSEVVLDLRYNGGGSVNTSRKLASLLAGPAVDGQVFARLDFNALHPEKTVNYRFTSSLASLPAAPLAGLSRVFIIASPSTASASELVINGLKPFVTVVQIGGTTYGKPYGFEPVSGCGTTYSAVNFRSVNALGAGAYDNGIAPTCSVADDLDHALGDQTEGRLAAALSYIRTGACPAGASSLQTLAQAVAKRDEMMAGDRRPVGMYPGGLQ